MNQAGPNGGQLFSKVRNPLFSSYYQKKAEWSQIKNGHLNDSNYAIADLKQQVYGPGSDETSQFYSGPTFRAPNYGEDFGT